MNERETRLCLGCYIIGASMLCQRPLLPAQQGSVESCCQISECWQREAVTLFLTLLLRCPLAMNSWERNSATKLAPASFSVPLLCDLLQTVTCIGWRGQQGGKRRSCYAPRGPRGPRVRAGVLNSGIWGQPSLGRLNWTEKHCCQHGPGICLLLGRSGYTLLNP